MYKGAERTEQFMVESTPRMNKPDSNIIARFMWFTFAGWYVGILIVLAAYIVCVTVRFMPTGLRILDSLPWRMTAGRRINRMSSVVIGDATGPYVAWEPPAQLPLAVRALYFVLVGWWLLAAWLALVWLATDLWVVTLGWSLGIAERMQDRVPTVLTLARY